MNAHKLPLNASLAAAVLASIAVATSAAEPEWKVGLAQVKVTPEQPVLMAGYAARTKPFEKVATDLFVKALVIEDNQGHRGALVTSDLIGFPAVVAESICERIQKSTGLARAEILLNSSHTHTGPQVSLKVLPQDDPGAPDNLRTIEYTRQLQDKVVDCVERAAAKLEAAQLSWGTGVAHFVMNRREFTANGVVLGANPRGLADRSVPVLQIAAADGTPRAILFGAAV
ncbi:MAG TPA: neutral/alkaline non-lysosomal ceramidase N-terminal domain-containing protein, partial [Planctomycetaceae bacterium]